jgi:beta-lactamase regulating signal transducer with metallopeptidase domain
VAWIAETRWLGLLADYLIKTTAALALAILLATLLRRRSAALRHFVLSVFLIGLLLIPFLPSFEKGWETPLLPSWAALSRRAPSVEKAEVVRTVGEPFAAGVIFVAHAPATEGDLQATRRLTGNGPGGNAPSGRLAGTLLLAVWASGLIVLLMRLGFGLLGASRLSRESRPLDDPIWQRLLERFLALVAIKRWVRLKSHWRIAVPLTWGIFRPVILMPDDSRNWDEDRQSSALFHELSHVKRIDFAVMLLVRLSLALFWFSPLTWVVFGMLKREQEKACDELVLRAGIKPSTYAATLLQFKRAAGFSWNPSVALLGIFAGPQINDRLVAILRQKLTFKEVKMRTRIILAVTIIFIVSLIGSARPAAPVFEPGNSVMGVAQAPAAPESIQETAAVAVSQEKQTSQEAEKKKEAEKKREAEEAEKKAAAQEKAKTAKAVVLSGREVKPGQVEVFISEGDKIKTIVLDHPIIIEGGEQGKEITLKIDGQDLVLKKGEQVRLIAKEHALTVLKEGEAPEAVRGTPIILKVEEKDGKKVISYGIYPVEAVKPAKSAAPYAAAAPVAVTAPVTVEVVEAGEKGKTYNVVYAPYPATATAYVVEPTAVEAAGHKELRQRLEEIKEQLNRIKERKPEIREDLKAVEESLQALSEQLEKTSRKLDEFRAARPYRPEAFTIVKTGEEGETKSEVEIVGGREKTDVLGIVSGEKDGATIFYRSREGMKDKPAYERAVARVKKELPEGYTLESKLDEESGEVTLKIKAPEGRGETDGLLKKVLAVLKEELKREPAAKKK